MYKKVENHCYKLLCRLWQKYTKKMILKIWLRHLKIIFFFNKSIKNYLKYCSKYTLEKRILNTTQVLWCEFINILIFVIIYLHRGMRTLVFGWAKKKCAPPKIVFHKHTYILMTCTARPVSLKLKSDWPIIGRISNVFRTHYDWNL